MIKAMAHPTPVRAPLVFRVRGTLGPSVLGFLFVFCVPSWVACVRDFSVAVWGFAFFVLLCRAIPVEFIVVWLLLPLGLSSAFLWLLSFWVPGWTEGEYFGDLSVDGMAE